MTIAEKVANFQPPATEAQWHTLTRRVADVDPLAFFRAAEGGARFYWREGDISIAAAGIAEQMTPEGPNRFEETKAWMRRLSQEVVDHSDGDFPGCFPRALAGFGFDERTPQSDDWRGFGAARVLIPAAQMTRFGGETWATASHRGAEDADALQRRLNRAVEQARTLRADTAHSKIYLGEDSSREEWAKAVGIALDRIRAGELAKVVLARKKRLGMNGRFPIERILERLNEQYPECYTFAFEPVAGRAFWGASPELLCQVRDGELRSMALAGSIDRGKDPKDDSARQQSLLNSAKEKEEHRLVVDALRESLAAISVHVAAPEAPGIRGLSNIQHLHTDIRARLRNGLGVLDAVAGLHPTPALCGAPRDRAAELIRGLEGSPRGWYGGPLGWLDMEGNGTFAVGIRSALTEGEHIHLFAGAGIVKGSDPQDEWNETALKMRALEDLLWSISE